MPSLASAASERLCHSQALLWTGCASPASRFRQKEISAMTESRETGVGSMVQLHQTSRHRGGREGRQGHLRPAPEVGSSSVLPESVRTLIRALRK